MPGLNLRAGLGAGMNASTNGGLTPMPAQTPTGPRQSTAPAFGYTAGAAAGPRTGAIGGCAVAAISALLLTWLWWSLPR